MTEPPLPDLLPSAQENLRQLNAFQDREEADVPWLQARIEAVSRFFGSSAYFVFVVAFIAVWIAVNAWGAHAGWAHVDEPPFFWLQGLVSANALLLTVSVLIRQNRMAKQAARRAHLDLHINLLTEEKVSKVLAAVHELAKASGRQVADEAEVRELSQAADPGAILSAIRESEAAEAAPAADAGQRDDASPAADPRPAP